MENSHIFLFFFKLKTSLTRLFRVANPFIGFRRYFGFIFLGHKVEMRKTLHRAENRIQYEVEISIKSNFARKEAINGQVSLG